MTPTGSPSTTELLVRARAGDELAFAELVGRHMRRLRAICLAFTRDDDDAADVLQDTLLAAHQHIDDVHDHDKFEAWLCRVATSKALMWLRARRRRPAMRIDAEGRFDASGHRVDAVPAWPVDPADAMERERLANLLHEFAQDLPDKYRAVWVLADVEELSMREVGEVLELGVPAVKTRLHRARLALRAWMAHAILQGGK